MNGFSMYQKKLNVRFLHLNDRITVCFVRDGIIEVKGISKCNYDEGDKYDIILGEQIALEKALKKRHTIYMKSRDKIIGKFNILLTREYSEIINHHINKYNKIKEKIANLERILKTTPDCQPHEQDRIKNKIDFLKEMLANPFLPKKQESVKKFIKEDIGEYENSQEEQLPIDIYEKYEGESELGYPAISNR